MILKYDRFCCCHGRIHLEPTFFGELSRNVHFSLSVCSARIQIEIFKYTVILLDQLRYVPQTVQDMQRMDIYECQWSVVSGVLTYVATVAWPYGPALLSTTFSKSPVRNALQSQRSSFLSRFLRANRFSKLFSVSGYLKIAVCVDAANFTVD